MDKTILERVAKEAQEGDTLVLSFLRTGACDMPYLYGMHKYGLLEIADQDYLAVLAVIRTRQWGSDWHRVVSVTVMQTFRENIDWFFCGEGLTSQTTYVFHPHKQFPTAEKGRPHQGQAVREARQRRR